MTRPLGMSVLVLLALLSLLGSSQPVRAEFLFVLDSNDAISGPNDLGFGEECVPASGGTSSGQPSRSREHPNHPAPERHDPLAFLHQQQAHPSGSTSSQSSSGAGAGSGGPQQAGLTSSWEPPPVRVVGLLPAEQRTELPAPPSQALFRPPRGR